MNDMVTDHGTSSPFERMAAALESIAGSLTALSQKLETTAHKPESPSPDDLELRALVLLAQQATGQVNVSSIADQLAVNRGTLYRLPRFKRQLDEMRHVDARRNPRQGFRRTDGEVEAIDE